MKRVWFLVGFLILGLWVSAACAGEWWILTEEGVKQVLDPQKLTVLKPGEVWRDPYLGMEFVWVPGGCFEMGCGPWDGDCHDNEKPVHEVCVDGFWMGRYEVTVGQFRRFVEETGYRTEAERSGGCLIWDGKKWKFDKGASWRNPGFSQGDDHPVVCVSWEDAKAFAKWLSKKTGYRFRLPTEAEWEYACRSGGRKVKYGTKTGDLSHDLANYWKIGGRDRWKYTSPVGSFPPNELGLYDMSGNVWEWCEDRYDANYYARSPRNNPKGPSKGKFRVVRGGSWGLNPRDLRCADRVWGGPGYRGDLQGLRLVRPVASQ